MNIFLSETRAAAEAITLEATGAGYAVPTLILSVLVPLVCALALFLCLRRADLKTKLLVFFIGTAVYVACDVFVFSDFSAAVKLLTGAVMHPVCGFILAAAAGIVFTGFCLLLCSAGITKPAGRIPLFLFTVLAAASCAALLCFNAGVNGVLTAAEIPFVRAIAGGRAGLLGADIICLMIYALFALLSFLCFIFNRSTHEIAENEKEYQIRHNRRRHGVAGTEKDETRCAACQYSRLMKTDPSRVICDTEGIVDCNHICRRFLYDPLKRMPERPPSPYEDAPAKEEAPAPAETVIPEVPDISDVTGAAPAAEKNVIDDADAAPDAAAEKSADGAPENNAPGNAAEPAEKSGTAGMASVFRRLSRKNKSLSAGEKADKPEDEHE